MADKELYTASHILVGHPYFLWCGISIPLAIFSLPWLLEANSLNGIIYLLSFHFYAVLYQ